MEESVVDRMVRDFQDRITTGTWQGVCAIDEAARDKVLECQADLRPRWTEAIHVCAADSAPVDGRDSLESEFCVGDESVLSTRIKQSFFVGNQKPANHIEDEDVPL